MPTGKRIGNCCVCSGLLKLVGKELKILFREAVPERRAALKCMHACAGGGGQFRQHLRHKPHSVDGGGGLCVRPFIDYWAVATRVNQLPPQIIINHEIKAASQPASLQVCWQAVIDRRAAKRRQASQSQLPLPLQLRHTPFTRCQPASQPANSPTAASNTHAAASAECPAGLLPGELAGQPRLRMTRLSLNQAQKAHRPQPTTPIDSRHPVGNQTFSQPAHHASNRCDAISHQSSPPGMQAGAPCQFPCSRRARSCPHCPTQSCCRRAIWRQC